MNKTTATARKRRAYAAAAALIIGGGWIAPSHALLGLPPAGALVVSISAPADGATVSGITTVRASVTIVGALTVGDVEFQLDGATLATDTSAPYAIAWNTATTGNGAHQLTAVAHDPLLGLGFTSAPVNVTVANDLAAPTVHLTAPAAGATVSGTVAVSADATDNVGVASVQFRLDGANLGAADTAAPYAVAWDSTQSSDGPHTLSAIARDAAGNVANAAAVMVTVANTTTPPTVSRVEQTDSAVSYTGSGWIHGDQSRAWSGGTASFSRAGGDQATFAFSGSRVSWIGYRGPLGGIADVFLDNVQVAHLDLFAPSETIQAAVFTSDVLADGAHQLRIQVTGTANASATDAVVVVDAFDVTATGTPMPPPSPGTGARHEETDPAIAYSPGAWLVDDTRAWSGGAAMYSASTDAQATFTFTGTGVTWIGYRGHFGGIVRVFLDGVMVAEIDTFSTTEEISVPVYATSGLAPGSHTLTVVLPGTKNPSADAAETAIDAFDVTP